MLIFAGTLYGVFHGQDMGELRKALAQCRTDWLVCAAGCVVVFVLSDAVALWMLLDAFGMGLRQGTCIFTSCIGFFFSAITPSATGGQPMEIYYLRKRGIPVSVTTMALLTMAMAYKVAPVVIGCGLTVFAPGLLRERFGAMLFLFYIGFILTAGLFSFLVLLIVRPQIARGIVIWIMSVLEELHILKDREKLQTELEVSMDMYHDAAAHLKNEPRVLAGVLGAMTLRRAALLSVTYCVYRALGLAGASWGALTLIQAAISLSVDLLPLPGGMGVSEALFVKVFGPVFGTLVLPGMLLSRGISHYCQLILCGLVTVLALALLKRHTKGNDTL